MTHFNTFWQLIVTIHILMLQGCWQCIKPTLPFMVPHLFSPISAFGAESNSYITTLRSSFTECFTQINLITLFPVIVLFKLGDWETFSNKEP